MSTKDQILKFFPKSSKISRDLQRDIDGQTLGKTQSFQNSLLNKNIDTTETLNNNALDNAIMFAYVTDIISSTKRKKKNLNCINQY